MGGRARRREREREREREQRSRDQHGDQSENVWNSRDTWLGTPVRARKGMDGWMDGSLVQFYMSSPLLVVYMQTQIFLLFHSSLLTPPSRASHRIISYRILYLQ